MKSVNDDITEKELEHVMELKRIWNRGGDLSPETSIRMGLPFHVYLSYRSLAKITFEIKHNAKTIRKMRIANTVVFAVGVVLLMFV